MFEMGSHIPFEYLKYKLWPKERSGSNCQFDSQPLKVRNHPDLFACKWHAIYRWKALNKNYNSALDITLIGGLNKKLWAYKIMGVPILGILKLSMSQP
jgi:hypothetical protein